MGGISGLVALPGSATYERGRPPFIAGFDDVQPQAVVSCAAAGEAAEALAFARRCGLEIAVRSAPGLWVAGNLANIQPQVITAAAAGLIAGAAINADLAAQDAKRAVGVHRHEHTHPDKRGQHFGSAA